VPLKVVDKLGTRFNDSGGAGPSVHFDDEALPFVYDSMGRPEVLK
jgi:hypothetical protein